jgi:hypothetical protein
VRFPAVVIVLAVRWYLRFGLSYRDVEELLAERGIQVDHVTVFRWVQRFTPLLVDASPAVRARCRRPLVRRTAQAARNFTMCCDRAIRFLIGMAPASSSRRSTRCVPKRRRGDYPHTTTHPGRERPCGTLNQERSSRAPRPHPHLEPTPPGAASTRVRQRSRRRARGASSSLILRDTCSGCGPMPLAPSSSTSMSRIGNASSTNAPDGSKITELRMGTNSSREWTSPWLTTTDDTDRQPGTCLVRGAGSHRRRRDRAARTVAFGGMVSTRDRVFQLARAHQFPPQREAPSESSRVGH